MRSGDSYNAEKARKKGVIAWGPPQKKNIKEEYFQPSLLQAVLPI